MLTVSRQVGRTREETDQGVTKIQEYGLIPIENGRFKKKRSFFLGKTSVGKSQELGVIEKNFRFGKMRLWSMLFQAW